ncbi:MAG: DNA polymerase III subunit delta' C-terminal domain-containing protein, partial [bacterium]
EIFLLEKIEQICKEKEEAILLLDSILWWFRDLILFKKNVDNKYLMNLDIKNSFSENINVFSFSKIENIIKLILEVKEDIKNNINLRLILEVLFLNIRSNAVCMK